MMKRMTASEAKTIISNLLSTMKYLPYEVMNPQSISRQIAAKCTLKHLWLKIPTAQPWNPNSTRGTCVQWATWSNSTPKELAQALLPRSQESTWPWRYKSRAGTRFFRSLFFRSWQPPWGKDGIQEVSVYSHFNVKSRPVKQKVIDYLLSIFHIAFIWLWIYLSQRRMFPGGENGRLQLANEVYWAAIKRAGSDFPIKS